MHTEVKVEVDEVIHAIRRGRSKSVGPHETLCKVKSKDSTPSNATYIRSADFTHHCSMSPMSSFG